MRQAFSDVKPMLEIIADVVSAEWQHRHWIASHLANSTGRGCSCFRSHGRTEVNAVVPIERLINQWDGIATAAAENDGADRHAFPFFDIRVERGIVAHRRRETAVWMRGFFF